MKKYLISIILGLLIASSALARSTGCKEGNCDNGYGKWVYTDKTTYEGEWVGTKKHGQGTETWPNGYIYKGEFKIILSFLSIIQFLAKDLNEDGLDQLKIEAIKPEALHIDGLSLFLSKSEKLNVKVVNKDVVLFRAIDQEKKYSESAIIDRKSGELIHEITRNIKSENSEKDIFFYSCRKKEKKV